MRLEGDGRLFSPVGLQFIILFPSFGAKDLFNVCPEFVGTSLVGILRVLVADDSFVVQESAFRFSESVGRSETELRQRQSESGRQTGESCKTGRHQREVTSRPSGRLKLAQKGFGVGREVSLQRQKLIEENYILVFVGFCKFCYCLFN